MNEITYLSGAIRREALNGRSDFGVLLTPLMGNVPRPLGMHAHDNGVFTEWKTKGKKPFDLTKFLHHLDMFRGMKHRCLFAVAPDVIGDWQATLARSAPVLPEIRRRGYRAALVAQNGLELHMDQIPWANFDVLFMGGGPEKRYVRKGNRKGEWKWTQGARRLMAEARRQGKDVHVGRVNSLLRLRQAQEWGATSADGTIIAFGPDIRTPEVQGWVNTLNREAPVELAHNFSSCIICRHKIELRAMTYRIPLHVEMQRVIDYAAAHPERGNPHGLSRPVVMDPAQLPVREQLPLAA